MRGYDTQQAGLFSYLSPEERVPETHLLRPIRHYVGTALVALSPQLAKLYAHTGRSSIAPEKLLRTLLLQVLYSLRSERLLMEALQYNLLSRWFVGLDLDTPVWDVTVFTKNRDRLLTGAVATAFFECEKPAAQAHGLCSFFEQRIRKVVPNEIQPNFSPSSPKAHHSAEHAGSS